MQCPECLSKETRKNSSDVWSCENCGWDEQDEIDHMNEIMDDEDFYEED